MKLKYQRLLYSTFFLIFFTIVPVLALYSAGYRYDFKRNRLEKTGILYIESKPKEAMVYLDGQYKNTTPSRLTKLLPGKYNVEVRKDDYYPWISEVEVKSNLTTFLKNTVLFRKNLPEIKIKGEINILTISLDQQKIIYSLVGENNEELRLFNLKNDSDFLIESFGRKTYNYLEFLAWAPDQSKALFKQVIGDFNKYLIVDVNTLRVKQIFDITRLNFDKLVWSGKNDSCLYGLRKTMLYQIDLTRNSTEPIFAANITDLQAADDKIYYITRIASDYYLNQKLLESEEKDKKIKLPSFSDYTLQASTSDLITLLDKNNNDLFIIDSNAFDTQNIEDEIVLQARAKNIFWSENFKNLIYYTNFELWFYNLDERQNELLTRYGETINRAVWYPENKYIVYQLGNTIRVTETRSGSIKNDLTLARLEKINQIVIDEKGDNLYFSGKIGNQQGIFQLKLQ